MILILYRNFFKHFSVWNFIPLCYSKKLMRKDHLKGIELIYEDRDIIVVNKPAGLLTMASATEREMTAYHILTDYVRKGCAKSPKRVFIVHRLDRDTSGIRRLLGGYGTKVG